MADALKEFQERLQERIKGDIGELMPDEVVKDLIVKTIEQEFLRPYTEIRGSGYYKQSVHCEARLLQYIKPHVEAAMLKYVAVWVSEHPGEIEKIVEDALGNEVGVFLRKTMQAFYRSQFESFKFGLIQELSKQ